MCSELYVQFLNNNDNHLYKTSLKGFTWSIKHTSYSVEEVSTIASTQETNNTYQCSVHVWHVTYPTKGFLFHLQISKNQ